MNPDELHTLIERRLDEARDVVFEVRLAFLEGRRPREETFMRMWAHLGDVAKTLALLQDDTPREIASQLFEFADTDSGWRHDVLPRWVAAARR